MMQEEEEDNNMEKEGTNNNKFKQLKGLSLVKQTLSTFLTCFDKASVKGYMGIPGLL